MEKNITQEDLISYVYGETSADEENCIVQALADNWELNEQYKDLVAVRDILQKIPHTSPSKTSIKLLLDYSNQMETFEAQL